MRRGEDTDSGQILKALPRPQIKFFLRCFLVQIDVLPCFFLALKVLSIEIDVAERGDLCYSSFLN